jgi:DNA-binding transcriptional MerR regulator
MDKQTLEEDGLSFAEIEELLKTTSFQKAMKLRTENCGKDDNYSRRQQVFSEKRDTVNTLLFELAKAKC